MTPYLQVEALSKSFGDLTLFENIAFGIGENRRVGLIARNGAGKTTLLNIIAGREGYDSGAVVFRRDLKVGYLEQNPQFPAGITVLGAAFHGDSPTLQAMAEYETALESGERQALEKAINRMDGLGAWDYESRAKQILTQLKITNFTQQVSELSGGQLKRIALANALITEPDLLILDEPTNHLDLGMTRWLEEYLAKAKLSLLMVTHDRYFLDRVCDEIIEIDNRRIYTYAGNYSDYLEKRNQRLEAAAAQRESDANLYRRELEWMRRQPQARATKARARIESFHELEERLRRERNAGSVRLNVKSAYIGKKIFELKDISKRYGERVLLDRFSYLFARYEKMGVIGDNGTGKSTFIKLLLGEVEPDSGTIDIGETVRFGYYSQQGLSFDDNAKVIDTVSAIAEQIELGDGRTLSASQFLQLFLFPPAVQHNFVGKLSGGEKRRLYLCTVLMRNPNFLVLDEPTNDLDIMTLQVLEEYLQAFSGCLIVVSHDRYFMDKVADHLLVFNGNGDIRDFPGNYSRYIEWSELKAEQERAGQAGRPKAEKPAAAADNGRRGQTARRKLSFNEKREMERLDREIPELETEKAALETAMSSGTLAPGELHAKSLRISEVIALIDEKSMRWLELSELE